jgi:beta-glucosidase-like glycosyl hydrolase
MGKEFHAKGANVQLGPGLCLARVPRNGRNFEYLSGEDPYLGYTLVQPVINGIQSQKVVANAKHYAMNNQGKKNVSLLCPILFLLLILTTLISVFNIVFCVQYFSRNKSWCSE